MNFSTKIPLLLYSYLATEMLGPFFASFLIINSVFFVAKLIPFLNFVLELNIDLSNFIRLLSYLFPKIFLYTIPMSALLGVTIGFARLSSDSEILALKASGISMYKILPPVLIVSTFIALFTSFVSIQLIPHSADAMQQLSYQLLKKKISKGIEEHVFTEALGDVVVYVDKIDQKSGRWHNVWVSDMRGSDNPIITMATSGEMTSSIRNMMVSLVLRNGSLHKPGNENAQIVQFDQYQINIPLKLPKNKVIAKKRSSLPMMELYSQAKLENRDPRIVRLDLIEFHQRLALPIGCLMISLMGLPLGLQARPGKKALGIQIGFLIFILYYIFLTLGKDMAEEGNLPVWFAMWAPNFLFTGLAIFWIKRIANEQPLIPEKLYTPCKELLLRLSHPFKKIYSYTANIILSKGGPGDTGGRAVVQVAEKDMIRGDAQKRIFHISACKAYNCIHCTLEFKDISVARQAGFKPCNLCKDLLGDKK